MAEGNIFDYLEWRGDLSFLQSGINVVDALIFSTLAYINYPLPQVGSVLLGDACRAWEALPESERYRGLEMVREQCVKLARILHTYRRFAGVRITCYEEVNSEENEKQFSAMTFILPNGVLFMAFRGTDSTLVGWKEDFNMALGSGTPAQLEATEYVTRVAEVFPDRRFAMGGHSKGGNLAVWAAVHLREEMKARITHVYNNDGPGFNDALTDSPEYKAVEHKILSFVPESSVVGVLMGCCDYLTIKSSSVSVLQHHPFTWRIVGRGFVYETERSRSGKRIEKMINDMLNSMDREETSQLIDELYAELTKYDEKTLADLRKHLFVHILRVLPKLTRFKLRSDEKQKRKELKDAVDRY